MKKFLWSVVGVGALLVGAQVAYTASDSQQFTVNVPQRVTIQAPTPAVLATLPDSSATLSFPTQVWQIKGNVRNGVTVNFKTLSAFVNTTDTSFKRDARLTLGGVSKTGPANWFAAGSLTDVTNYVAGDGEASVTIFSDNVGQAAQNVHVDFLTMDIAEVLEGDYVTTVVGTVTAN